MAFYASVRQAARSACARSSPGHVVNRLQAALWREAYSPRRARGGDRRRHRRRDHQRARPALGGPRAVRQPAPVRRRRRHRAHPRAPRPADGGVVGRPRHARADPGARRRASSADGGRDGRPHVATTLSAARDRRRPRRARGQGPTRPTSPAEPQEHHMTGIDLDALVAIDVHTHAEVSDGTATARLPDALMAASAKYFKAGDGRAPRPLDELAEHYRERRMAAVVFTVDAEPSTGHPPIANEDDRRGAAAAPPRRADPVRAASTRTAGRPASSAARRLVEEHGVRGFKFHPSLQGFSPERPRWPTRSTRRIAGARRAGAVPHRADRHRRRHCPAAAASGCSTPTRCCSTTSRPTSRTCTIILAHPSFPWQDEALAVATHKAERLHRPVRLVAEVLPAAARAVRQHAAQATRCCSAPTSR